MNFDRFCILGNFSIPFQSGSCRSYYIAYSLRSLSNLEKRYIINSHVIWPPQKYYIDLQCHLLDSNEHTISMQFRKKRFAMCLSMERYLEEELIESCQWNSVCQPTFQNVTSQERSLKVTKMLQIQCASRDTYDPEFIGINRKDCFGCHNTYKRKHVRVLQGVPPAH